MRASLLIFIPISRICSGGAVGLQEILKPFSAVWTYSFAAIIIYLAVAGAALAMDTYHQPQFILNIFHSGISFGLQIIFYITVIFYVYLGFSFSKRGGFIESCAAIFYAALMASLPCAIGAVFAVPGGASAGAGLALGILIIAMLYISLAIISGAVGAFAAAKLDSGPARKRK